MTSLAQRLAATTAAVEATKCPRCGSNAPKAIVMRCRNDRCGAVWPYPKISGESPATRHGMQGVPAGGSEDF